MRREFLCLHSATTTLREYPSGQASDEQEAKTSRPPRRREQEEKRRLAVMSELKLRPTEKHRAGEAREKKRNSDGEAVASGWCPVYTHHMRGKTYLGLFVAIVVLALSSRSRGMDPARQHSQSPETLTIGRAMEMFYGNYDAEKHESVASLPREKTPFRAPGEEQMIAKALFHAFSTNAGEGVFILVTYAVPADEGGFDCHACAPTIGMAVFSQEGMQWRLVDSSRAVTISGGWGKPSTDVRVVRIGPKRSAVEITDIWTGQGETTKELQLLIPWNGTVNVGLERIIADDNKGLCGPDGDQACYANHRTVNFVHEGIANLYSLQLKLTGTDLPDSSAAASAPARMVRGVEMLRFDNGKYVQVWRRGDLTTIDHAVAKQEGLK